MLPVNDAVTGGEAEPLAVADGETDGDVEQLTVPDTLTV